MKKSKKKTLTRQEVENTLRPLSNQQIDSLSASELRILLRGEQKIRQFYEDAAKEALELNKELEDKILNIESKLVILKNRLFCPSSERSKNKPTEKSPATGKRRPLNKERDLRKRYPNAEVIEKEISLQIAPTCKCCQGEMNEMGIFEQSQYLTVIPKKYLITNVLRMKYHCTHCFGSIETTPPIPRVVPRSSYSDEFLVDAVLSKFCDLIPIERYCAMAGRQGFMGLPPSSLHEGSRRLGEFLRGVYELIRIETLDSYILQGDETPHRMLEGHEKDKWYLWGFFSTSACFFECHESRAGTVAADVLSESGCRYFISDAYTGYSSAISEVNKLREQAGLEKIVEALCNSHSRRYFDECGNLEDARSFIEIYKKIYKAEKDVKKNLLENNFEEAQKIRSSMEPHFKEMKIKAEEDLARYSSHHQYSKACSYFLNNYEGLTACLKDPRIPLDNNLSERGLRSHVVGRKIWGGTHSVQGAETAAIHFTLVEACKLNKINPRIYYQEIIQAIHYKKPLLTPSQFKEKSKI